MANANKYRHVLRQINKDLNDCAKTKSPVMKVISFFTNINFQVLFLYRHVYYLKNKSALHKLIMIVFNYISRTMFQCYIAEKATIGSGLNLPHPTGIVIGEDVIIGNNVTIYQQVTLGSHGKQSSGRAYPIIEDNAIIYAGAKLIGNITVGRNSVIGANAVVNKDVPPDSIAVGVPAKIINKRDDQSG
ncbi:serine O-acetyltransferase EpsC [Paenibacillus solisilvae]|uniref:Serine acetyltransferase n=1 Tax=Paenibacillus solisilvae TaxID=2486751 RepID=A0ABW0W3X0_9BACL